MASEEANEQSVNSSKPRAPGEVLGSHYSAIRYSDAKLTYLRIAPYPYKNRIITRKISHFRLYPAQHAAASTPNNFFAAHSCDNLQRLTMFDRK